MANRVHRSARFAARFFLLFLTLAGLAAVSGAQTTVVSGTVLDSNGIAYAGAQLRAQLVTTGGSPISGQPTVTVNNAQQCRSGSFGSAPCQVPFLGANGPVSLDNTGSFNLTLQDNTLVTPAATQWLISVTITPGVAPPLGTGPQTCSAQLTISGASQPVSASFAACPALSQVAGGANATSIQGHAVSISGLSVNQVLGSQDGVTFSNFSIGALTGVVTASSFGVKADVKYSLRATLANASGNITINAADPPFLVGDVGKACFATNLAGGGTGSYFAGVLRMNAGTIDVVTDATHAHCTQNANATCVALCTVAWGSDDTTALINAGNSTINNNTNRCLALVLPSGGMFTTKGQFNLSTCPKGVVTTVDQPARIYGQGIRATYFAPLGNLFDFTTCTGLLNSCFMGVDGLSYTDLSINGFGNDATGAASLHSIFYVGCDGYAFNIDIYQWGASDTNMVGYQFSPCGTITNNINSNGGGALSILANQNSQNLLSNSFFCCGATGALSVSGGTKVSMFFSAANGYNCGAAVFTITSGQLNYFDSWATNGCSSGNQSVFSVGATGKLYLTEGGNGCVSWGGGPPMSGNESCVFLSASGAKAFVQNTNLVGAGTGVPVGTTAGSQFWDQGGNSYSGGAASNFVTGTFFKALAEGNCSSSASPAVCGTAGSGSVVVAAGATTVVVNTTAITAGSQIQLTNDDSLGTKLGVTCNTNLLAAPPTISARVPGTSFTITLSAAPVTNPECFSYSLIN